MKHPKYIVIDHKAGTVLPCSQDAKGHVLKKVRVEIAEKCEIGQVYAVPNSRPLAEIERVADYIPTWIRNKAASRLKPKTYFVWYVPVDFEIPKRYTRTTKDQFRVVSVRYKGGLVVAERLMYAGEDEANAAGVAKGIEDIGGTAIIRKVRVKI